MRRETFNLISFLICLGITSLFEAYSATPDYCHEEGQQDVATQLTHVSQTSLSLQGKFQSLLQFFSNPS